MEGNPVLPIVGAAVAGFVLLPIEPILGGALLAAVAAWSFKYYREHSKLACVFRNCGLTNKDNQVPQLREKDRTDGSVIYRYSLPPGLSAADFQKNQDAIEGFLGKEVSIKGHAKNIIIEVFNGPIEQYDYEFTGELEIGRTRGCRPLCLDLVEHPHVMICGETGSGKTTLSRGLSVSLILLGYRLHLVDLKGGVEFAFMRNSSQVVSFSKTTQEALSIIGAFAEEIERRYSELYACNMVDIQSYNKKAEQKWPYEVLIVDEFAELTDKEAIQTLKSIAARGRACGCNLIVSTQRPDAKILDSAIKANITNIIGLKTVNRVNSEIIIGAGGLERLHGNGHGLLLSAGKLTEFQVPWLSAEHARELIAHTFVDKSAVEGRREF